MKLTDTGEFKHILKGLNGAKLGTRYVRVFAHKGYVARTRHSVDNTRSPSRSRTPDVIIGGDDTTNLGEAPSVDEHTTLSDEGASATRFADNAATIKMEIHDESPSHKRRRLNDQMSTNQQLHNNNTNTHESSGDEYCTACNARKIKLEYGQKEFAAMRERIEYLEYQLDAVKREKHKYISDMLLRMKALKEMAIKGSEPLYGSVPMHNNSRTKNRKYSEKCYQLWERVMDRESGQIVLEVVNAFEHSRKSIVFKKAINKYLIANGNTVEVLGRSLAQLLIEGQQCEVDEVLEEFIISKQHRILALMGQKGLRAKLNIPRNTCLGQYVGVTYLKEEYVQIFENSSEGYLRNMYAFDLNVDVDEEEVELVLDCFALTRMIGESGHLMRINDCRLDIHQPRPSNDDRMFENVEIVECKVNGWPVVFVVTSKDINAGDELCAWFGENFGDAMKGWDENMKWRHRIRMCLDNQVMDEERDALVNDRHDVYDSD